MRGWHDEQLGEVRGVTTGGGQKREEGRGKRKEERGEQIKWPLYTTRHQMPTSAARHLSNEDIMSRVLARDWL